MKKLLLLLLVAAGGMANAGTIDRDLQAVLLSPKFAAAAKQANRAVHLVGTSYVAVTGETSVERLGGPVYYFLMPILAVRVPLSPQQPVNVGDIVGVLRPGLNSPVPDVDGVYFKTAPDHP